MMYLRVFKNMGTSDGHQNTGVAILNSGAITPISLGVESDLIHETMEWKIDLIPPVDFL